MSSRPRPGSPGRGGRIALRLFGWLVGVPLALFRFLRRATPIETVAPPGSGASLAPDGPDGTHREDAYAVGPVVHRRFDATIRAPRLSAAQLLSIIAADPNVIAPSEVLRFEKTRGEPGDLREGDAVRIRMAGPWDGPVEVTRRWEEGFRLAATRKHPQLGQLEFRARDDGDTITMQIQTRERAARLAFHLLRKTGIVHRMQTHTWTAMLENAARLAGGRPPERITVSTWSESGS